MMLLALKLEITLLKLELRTLKPTATQFLVSDLRTKFMNLNVEMTFLEFNLGTKFLELEEKIMHKFHVLELGIKFHLELGTKFRVGTEFLEFGTCTKLEYWEYEVQVRRRYRKVQS
ncbi:uncharacterized protein LOC141532735 [Cotesia typhae]|uniref:uncharacterized protein LOC141532735 n=1 Tax=Cotesia typhae TaxID=2053667 RepID=UPI003D687860